MKKIQKHEFEAVSLLTVENGLLELTVIPAIGQPDWLLPTRLILAVDEFSEHIWTYLWQDPAQDNRTQEVMVYQLLPRSVAPDKVVVVEGNTDVHRVGLLTQGKLTSIQVRISDVKDIEGDATSDTTLQSNGTLNSPFTHSDEGSASQFDASSTQNSELNLDYVFQLVEIDGIRYIVPDIDTLSHHLIDLDS